jgi:hypothetical protein
MIAIRRVHSRLPLVRLYEIQNGTTDGASGQNLMLRRGSAVRRLERLDGIGEAWTLIDKADRAFINQRGRWVTLIKDEDL